MSILIESVSKDEIVREITAAVISSLKASRESEQKQKMYGRAEVCELCHISLPTFHAWVNNGTLQAISIGGRTLVSQESLDRAMKVKRIAQFKPTD